MISLKLSAKIAKTHLLSRKKQSIVAALGVTFGIAMFIAMMGFMTGVNKILEDTMLSATPDIHIYNNIQPSKTNVVDEVYPESYMKAVYHQKPSETKLNLHNGFQIADIIRKDPRVYGVSPLLLQGLTSLKKTNCSASAPRWFWATSRTCLPQTTA
jgi:lipoprotein-releasing system permease protein